MGALAVAAVPKRNGKRASSDSLPKGALPLPEGRTNSYVSSRVVRVELGRREFFSPAVYPARLRRCRGNTTSSRSHATRKLYGSRVLVAGSIEPRGSWVWSAGNNDWLAAKLMDMPLHRIWRSAPLGVGCSLYGANYGKRPDDASFEQVLSELSWFGRERGRQRDRRPRAVRPRGSTRRCVVQPTIEPDVFIRLELATHRRNHDALCNDPSEQVAGSVPQVDRIPRRHVPPADLVLPHH